MELVQDLFDEAPCGYHCLDANGTFLYVNNTELNWLGYSREELVGQMTPPDLLTPHSAEVFAEYFPRLKSEGTVRDVQLDF
ncbi:MAG TPA: PAS domain S-box protein, partial [Candidatus Limnocylindrales bacterium]|nr:PAS domain S-box protein [Candidatus Limnocylindrales bacterium]